MILSDKWIKEQAGMIEPFIDHTVREIDGKKACSFGLSSAGYDLRLASPVMIKARVDYCDDPKNALAEVKMLETFESDKGQYVIVPTGAAWASSVEYIKMPKNAVALLQPKSSYARCGIAIINPLIEPGWCGNMTISFINANPNPVKLYINEGFAQMIFYSVEDVEKTYAERGGLYQNTAGVAFARV